jgi:hypothetical protein
MSFHPNDLITDDDLLAYESTLFDTCGRDEFVEKREKAIEDWLFPILAANGFTPDRLRTRFEPASVLGFTGAAYSDLTAAAIDDTADDLNLAAVFATPGSDALYVGFGKPFRGLSWRMLDAVSAVSGTVTVQYFADGWKTLRVTTDMAAAGVPFTRGGAMTWRVPSDWVKRPVNGGDALYFVKVTVSATPTSAKAGQLGVIRRSVLCAPAAFKTLALIMREAKTGSEGPWREKAAEYQTDADAALERALQIVAGEFDTDESDQVSPTEETQTRSEVARGPFRLERG